MKGRHALQWGSMIGAHDPNAALREPGRRVSGKGDIPWARSLRKAQSKRRDARVAH